jgi:hypothetical protein
LVAVVQPASALSFGAQVNLSWVNTASFAATSIVVERAVGTGSFSAIASLPATDTSYVDNTVVPGAYRYRVNALSSTGPSAYAGPVGVTVQSAATTMTLTTSNASTNVGDNVIFTATVNATSAIGTPTGKVTFTANGVAVETVLSGASATFSTTALPAGTHTVTAAYLDPAAAFAPASAQVTQTVTKRATATVLVNTPNPAYVGQSVTFTATVRPVTGTGVPTGRILFTGTGAVASVMLDAAGVATYTTNITAPFGNNTVTADYSGDPAFLSSTTSVIQTTVDKLATTTVVSSNRVPAATYGQNVTFTATVRPVSGAAIPTGSVQFSVDGTVTTAALNAQGRASFTAAGLSAGSHAVTAVYSGSATLGASTSAPFAQNVSQAPSATTVTSSRNPSVYGQSVTFTARVTPAVAGGFVSFTIDGVVWGSAALDATGRATLVVATLDGGTNHTVTATYDGLLNHAPSSGSMTQSVRWATTTVLSTSQPTALRGTNVTFSAAVTPIAPGVGVPAGTVQFRVDGNNLGGPVALDASGVATISSTTLSVGRHTIVAIYSGNAVWNASTSTNVPQRIQ